MTIVGAVFDDAASKIIFRSKYELISFCQIAIGTALCKQISKCIFYSLFFVRDRLMTLFRWHG